MAEELKTLSHPQFCQDVTWDPFSDLRFVLSPFLLSGGLCSYLGSSSWSGYSRSRLFSPALELGFRIHKQHLVGPSEVCRREGKWTISLDVKQFSPEEITISIKEDYLEITGNHNDRQDEHGFISRGFTRKYKLPSEAEKQNIHSYLTGDGILLVEIPLTVLASLPQRIPVQVEQKIMSLNDDDDDAEEVFKEEDQYAEVLYEEVLRQEMTDAEVQETLVSEEAQGDLLQHAPTEAPCEPMVHESFEAVEASTGAEEVTQWSTEDQVPVEHVEVVIQQSIEGNIEGGVEEQTSVQPLSPGLGAVFEQSEMCCQTLEGGALKDENEEACTEEESLVQEKESIRIQQEQALKQAEQHKTTN